MATLILAAALVGFPGCAEHHRTSPVDYGIPGNSTGIWPDSGHTSRTRPDCDLPTGTIIPGGDFTVAVADRVDPAHAPIPTNPGERLVFAQLYETLVRVDCAGHLLPNLASGWTCTADSSTWIFSLRENARFWDGTPVSAASVLASWYQAQEKDGRRDPWTWLNAHAGTIKALDGRRLSISLPEPQAAFPLLLAHPATAVAVTRQGWTWPVGSGPARLGADTPRPLPDLVCRPNPHHPRAPAWHSLTFQCRPGMDPRDLVAGGCDLLESSTARDAAFFREVPTFQILPLPLARTYLLLCPPLKNPTGCSAWNNETPPNDLAQAMNSVAWQPWARLVIPGPGTGACPQVHGPVTALAAAPLAWRLADKKLDADTLVYPADDAGAKDLAEYLAARLPREIRLVPLAPEPLKFVLQWQMAGAGIMTVDQEYPTGCLQLSALIGSVGWLQALLPGTPATQGDSLAQAQNEAQFHPGDPVSSLLDSGYARSLGASHGWLVLRRGMGGIKLSYDAVPWLEGWGRLDGAAAPQTGHP